jgi:DNA-binding response OmpR family regulator
LKSLESGWDDILSKHLARYGIYARIRVLIQHKSVM